MERTVDYLISFINGHLEYAPYLIFFALFLAGFNIPVSEDGMLFLTAYLAKQNPEKTPLLFAAVFLGAYISDLISYFLGRFLGPKLWNIKFFSKMVSKERVSQVTNFYQKYGIFTLIFGRFIPFGVRNALFLTAGLGKMNFLKFALSDLLACTVSCTTYFYLYYQYGETVIEYIKQANYIIFALALSLVLFLFFKKKILTK